MNRDKKNSFEQKYCHGIFRSNVCLLSLLFFFIASPVAGQDTVDTVMARMRPQSAVRIGYQEIRYLQLLTQPWEGSGFLYALPPGILVKEQLLPRRELMGASDNRLYFYDPLNHIRHQGEFSGDDPLSLNVAAFKALVNGDRQLLEKFYHTQFYSGSGSWMLTLKARDESAAEILEKIEISGLPGQAANKISVFQVDGDHTEFVLSKDELGEHLRDSVMCLIAELQSE